MTAHDIAIVGAGIVGLATALKLLERQPDLRLAILDKEGAVGEHQTGHNSGVIHGGLYYRPGSLKARLCMTGARQMMEFCQSHEIPHELCGKVVVATEEGEVPALDALERRGLENGVPGLRRIGPDELRELEPHARGVAALHSPQTGIVDYGEVARAMAADLRSRGVDLLLYHAVHEIREDAGGLSLQTTGGEVRTSRMINCAGLQADVVARRAGARTDVAIVPFRGEYYVLRPERRGLVRSLIYPVPDPRLPFLGVHFTRTVHGGVEAGPNAVLAFAREGYRRRSFNPREMLAMAGYPGFWRMGAQWWRTGLDEMRRSLSIERFAASLRRLVPEVQARDLLPSGSGVRAQAVGRDGRLLDDFVVVQSARAVHVLNAPSPAATASLAIGGYLADLAQPPKE